MLTTVLTALIIASAFPAGYLLAYLCKDELKGGRNYFRAIAWACLFGILVMLFLAENYSVILTLAYVSIVSLISVEKSYDQNNKKSGK
jgi:FtsH-binding integral membrane protein